jgi:hypothetical protein
MWKRPERSVALVNFAAAWTSLAELVIITICLRHRLEEEEEENKFIRARFE